MQSPRGPARTDEDKKVEREGMHIQTLAGELVALMVPGTLLNALMVTGLVLLGSLHFWYKTRQLPSLLESSRAANKDQKGITGLETAIVLIAFVMVASVFAYVVLSSGLYSSQKAKEAVNAGLQETRQTVELKGNVVARLESQVVTEIYLTVSTVPGGDSVDLTDTTDGENKVVISYSDQYQQIASLDWTSEKLTGGDDSILDPGELFQITVDLSAVNDAAADGEEVGPYTKFMLEVKPPAGAVLSIERTIPARASQLVTLY